MNKNTLFDPPLYEEYKGFLHIRCRFCGKEKTFTAKMPITHFQCECNKLTELGTLKRAWMHCECGRRARYHTNADTPLTEIECVRCGSPVAMEYNRKKRSYTTIKNK